MSTGALPGFRDFYPTELAERAHVMGAWRQVAGRFGFVEYDGPPLEPLDLYTRKSGDEIVGQLYAFTDRGGREVALRPEMTPTFARMVAARANTLRKPVKWFSLPQLFRYERQQKGRLREHFQLNVDIVGESDVAADAELLAVAIDVMRELGLGPDDVVARVSDRRLLHGLVRAVGVSESAIPAVFAAVDKIEREPRASLERKLAEAGVDAATAVAVLDMVRDSDYEALRGQYGGEPALAETFQRLDRYRDYLSAHGVGDWVRIDLSIVRGLAYYTGIVFELFDARGEFRAICGGGRYDTLLESLGGVSLPALGFGMGDVVLSELLRARGLMAASAPTVDYWVAAAEGVQAGLVLRVVTALRRRGVSADYVLNTEKLVSQKSRTQVQTGQKAGAHKALIVRDAQSAEVLCFHDHTHEKSLDLRTLLDPGSHGTAAGRGGDPSPCSSAP